MADTATPPTAPEQRTVDVDVQALDTRGRTLHGYAAVYGVDSGDLGGFRERIAPGAFAGVLDADVRCLLNHDPNQVLGRTRSGTLRLFDEQRGLRFEADLPDSPLGDNVRAAVSRGDIDGASFRFEVGDENWAGEVRTVRTVKALHDVTVATYGAYPAASVELRTRPDSTTQQTPTSEENSMNTEDRHEGGAGTLTVEDRTQEAGPTVEQRVGDALRSIRKGETRSLDTTSAAAITPTEQATYLFDRLRASSVALASGMTVIPTTRESITWPQIVTDVDPTWVAEKAQIPAGDPGLAELTATPRKLAHRVEFSNEVADDSEPAAVDALNTHLATMLGLKLDLGVFEGNPGANPNSIRGLKFNTAVPTIAMGGANGGALTNYAPLIRAVGRLRSANVPPPYAIAMHPDVLTELELLMDTAGNQLAPPANLPPIFTSSQLSTTETAGTSTNARSAYVYAPAQLVLVRRTDAQIEVDRSRLFDYDMSEMRGKTRADLLVPNAAAAVRIVGITPPA